MLPPLEIHNCEQGTDEWHSLRCGIVTASEFSAVMAKGEGKTRRAYMLRLVGEIITGEPAERYSNSHMDRGHVQEPTALASYAFLQDAELTRVGFLRRGGLGCSPDALVGDDGMVEAKSRLAHIQLETLLADKVPSANMAQCQGALLISGRQWLDYVSICPKLPLFVKRVERDEVFIARLIAELDAFMDEMQQLVSRFSPMEQAA